MTLLSNMSGVMFAIRRVGVTEALMTTRGKTIGVIATICLLALLVFKQTYSVRAGAECQIVWNGDEADVFLQEVSDGYQMSYAEVAFNVGEAILLGPWGEGYGRRRRHHDNVMLVITAAKVQRFEVTDTSLTWLTPVDGNLFAGSASGIQKWVGNRFVPATVPEVKHFEETLHSDTHGPDYDNVNGWSARILYALGGGEHRYALRLAGKPLSLEVRGFNRDVSIDVLRPGQARETIWHLSERPRWVSKTEYQEVFGKR